MFRYPGHGPSFQTLLDDLTTRDARKIARHLGVTPRTLASWQSTGNPPRLAYMALFWESRWGVSTINCAAINEARLAHSLAGSLQEVCDKLRSRIAHLEGLADFGSANEPHWLDADNAAPAQESPDQHAPAGALKLN